TALSYIVIEDSVHLSWMAAPNSARALIGYNVYRDGNLIALETSTNYSDTNLANGIYQYYVTAQYSSGESLPSNTVTATVEVLYPPMNLTYSVSDDDVTLYWDAAATSGGMRSFLGYKVYREGVLITQTMSLSYADNNLSNGTYQYYVTALYDSGESDPTNTVNVLMEVFYPATNLTHTVNGDDVSLSWTAAVNSGGLRAIQGYKVYRDDVEIAQVIGTDYLDSDLANGIYQYYVVAVYTTSLSAPSNTITALVEVLYPPTSLSYMTNDDDVILSWIAAPTSARGFLGYKVYRDGVLLTLVNDITYTDSGLANGVYQYYVTAMYDSGESAATNTVTVIMEVLYPATNLSYVVNGDDVTLNWTAAATSGGLRNFITYKVLRDNIEIAQTTALSYLDADLSNGIYHYSVIASYDSGDAEASNIVEVLVEVLYQPTALSYIVIEDSVHLSWMAAPNSARALIGYNVYRDGNLIALEVSTNYSDNDLANGIYQYYVTAQYGSGESLPSNTVTAMVEVLYPPMSLTYSVLDDDVTLYWDAAATSGGLRSFLGYKVYRDGVLITQTMSLSYADNNLSNGTYQYYVTAIYDSGESDPTNTVNVLVEVYYPATNLTYLVNGDDVSLSWTAAVNSGGLRAIQGYKVYRDDTEIAQVIGTDYLDSDLANGIYQYYVVAVYTTGVSTPSNTVTALVEVLYPPSNLSYMTNDDDVILSWNAAPTSARGFLGYKVYRDGILLTLVNNVTYTDAGLANGVYQYYVTAMYDSGESAATNTVTVIMEVLYPATNLSYVVNGDDVTLNWTAAATSGGLRNFITYKVLRDNIEIAQSTALTYLDADLANGIYHYSIIASYDSGDAEASNSVEVLVEVLYQPTALSYIVIEDSVHLSWMAAPNSARALIGYNVYRDGVLIALETSTNYSDTNLSNGVYQYYVTALYGSGESLPSNTVTATVEVLYPPMNLTYSVSDDDVTLYWNAAATSGGMRNFLGYKVYRDGLLITQTMSLSYADNNLSNGTYQYYVIALYDSGESDPTNTVNVLVEVFYPATNLT
ncbi:MAG: fibronectin type III domain-containing protein, partial [Candidatus Cloacimonadaceae bacterium]|nr:fibronectin type III domain-containing protein [Candidatus Cloacimonadaceae bacterium]